MVKLVSNSINLASILNQFLLTRRAWSKAIVLYSLLYHPYMHNDDVLERVEVILR